MERRRWHAVAVAVLLGLAGCGTPAPVETDGASRMDTLRDTRGDVAAVDAGPDVTRDADAVTPDGSADAPFGDTAPPPDTTAPDVGSPDARTDTAADVAEAADGAVEPVDPDVAPTPPLLELTVNRLPAAMNGTVPYRGAAHPETAFRLLVPEHRFTVDVRVGGATVDPDSLAVTARFMNSAGRTELRDVTDRLMAPSDASGFRTWRTTAADGLAPGPLELHAVVRDFDRAVVREATLGVDVGHLAPHLDPFTELDTWLVVLSRDLFATTLSPRDDGSIDITATYLPDGDGVPDFEEALYALGLFSTNAATNALVRERVIAEMRAITHGIYHLSPAGMTHTDSVPIRFYFEGDEGAPAAADFATGQFSMIAVGGDGEAAAIANRNVGRALLDPNNQSREDNTVYGLGVFTTQVARFMLSFPITMVVLGTISPVSGTPIGLLPGDAAFLGPDVDVAALSPQQRTRYGVYNVAAHAFALATAVTLCHEVGHSLGLVPPGVPPRGLFGGVSDVAFTVADTDDWHINTPGLNVMQTNAFSTGNFSLDLNAHFNPLNLAYLRRQLIVTGQVD